MSNLQTIAELCVIVEMQARIIRKQSELLEQHGAVALAEEIAEANERMARLLGAGETPDEYATGE